MTTHEVLRQNETLHEWHFASFMEAHDWLNKGTWPQGNSICGPYQRSGGGWVICEKLHPLAATLRPE